MAVSVNCGLDPFGRPLQIYVPDPDAPVPSVPVLAASMTYLDAKPLSYIDVRQMVGPVTSVRSVAVQNGLGETVLAFDQGDHNDWIIHDWTESNSAGQVVSLRRPQPYLGDPVVLATTLTGVSLPNSATQFELSYDDFGRPVHASEAGVGFSQELWRRRYLPLALETQDAAQLTPGSPHSGAYQRAEYDGRGHQIQTVQHLTTPVTGDLVTTTSYTALGQPETITRTGPGVTYSRSLVYNTLGQLMLNREPNTGNNWRYAWDDAGRLVGTSDARGCGENLFYDGLGRVLGEDYSPCLASQAAYSAPAPDLANGRGLETFSQYDTYEAGQLSPDATFNDQDVLGQGQLVSVRDRGSATRFSYDARGRVRRVARVLAQPGASVTKYTRHWFTSRLDYDLGGRLTRRTTGVDIPEFLVAGASEERYTYTPRGALNGIDSSYGSLIRSTAYETDGALSSIVYGDVRNTTARYAYDARRRLTMYQVIAPAQGAIPPTGYFDNRYSAYDEVGNPLTIEDFRIAWTPLPPEAAPVEQRTLVYDDLYRLTQVDNRYKTRDGTAPWQSPFAPEVAAHDVGPVPLQVAPTRIAQQNFSYDILGNLTGSTDDLSKLYDRSLGANLSYGSTAQGPNQLQSGPGLRVQYDATGNVAQLRIDRPGSCPNGTDSRCAQRFAYDWDEVGQLVRARRWDYGSGQLPPQPTPEALPTTAPAWDLRYAYSSGNRVRKSATDKAGVTRHTLEIFDTLRAEHVAFDAAAGTFEVNRDNVQVYPGGLAHAFWDASGQLPHQTSGSQIVMHLVIGDHLGSSSVVINHATSDLVERTTYQPYGAVESDYRTAKWQAFREPYKFTGKEEDLEVGATYFGARYYQPYLGRFLSADPLTVHGLGSDLNPYAYVRGRVMTNTDPLGLADEPLPQRTAEEQAEWEKLVGENGGGCQGMECAPQTQADGGMTVPTVDIPEPIPEKAPYEPGNDMNRLDRWIWGGEGAFHNAVTSDTNLQTVQYGFTGVAMAAATVATGGLALEIAGAAGLTAEGVGASMVVNSGRAAMAFTEMSLAEQGVVLGGGGGVVVGSGALAERVASRGTIYAGHTAPGRYADRYVMARGADYARGLLRDAIEAIFRDTGCHTCGTKVGSFVGDHQVPNALNGFMNYLQRFYPQCTSCSIKQGNEVKKILKVMRGE